ncbi:hypothetical protein MB46_10340 [Arthrobacter alpinus]|uniref:hypothetical protein n=1 Tax=Arthrobacter alpinus TaxID=656366 RepID=UPI0005CA0B75|nr:hypothetical protein [Arthrobacter alpinus]ALV45819.1 hypothetical protein MB46_10340 [Arthrobacter alpinus]
MIDLVEHVPIKSSKAKILQLQELAMDSVCERATSLQYRIAGEFTFRVIELPLSSYLECRVPVEPDEVAARVVGGHVEASLRVAGADVDMWRPADLDGRILEELRGSKG